MDQQEIDWRFNNHARGPHGFGLGKGVPGGGISSFPTTMFSAFRYDFMWLERLIRLTSGQHR